MKRLSPIALALGVSVGLFLSWMPDARAGATYQTPTTTACTTDFQACSGGTCTPTAPTIASTAGIATANVQGFVLRICAVPGQTLSGAGTVRDYHCTSMQDGGTGTPCTEVVDNRQTVTASSVRCQEFAPFVVPYVDNTTDRMVWVANGVTVSGGSFLGVTTCPQY